MGVLTRIERHFTEETQPSLAKELQQVQEEVDDVQIQIQSSEAIVVYCELVLVATMFTNHLLGVIHNVPHPAIGKHKNKGAYDDQNAFDGRLAFMQWWYRIFEKMTAEFPASPPMMYKNPPPMATDIV